MAGPATPPSISARANSSRAHGRGTHRSSRSGIRAAYASITSTGLTLGAIGRGTVYGMSGTAPVELERPETEEVTGTDEVTERDVPWIVIVWNDPVNLMSYVTWVLQKLFGYPRAKAEKLMMDVHTKGKAVVSNGARDKCESDVARLHAYGLWATMQKDV